VKVIHRVVNHDTVTVLSGNTLSGISEAYCGIPGDWTGIYKANRNILSDPNKIYPRQVLTLDCSSARITAVDSPKPPKADPPRASGKIWDVTYGYPNVWGDGDHDGFDLSHSPWAAAPVHRSITVASSGSNFGNVNPNNYSGFQQCVISRESGGNSQVMNSSGHYGLYQFSASTWAAYGGNPADFGHASASEQTQIFDNAMARGGQSNWSPYDGC
jgi:hypothetical protein